MKRTQSRKVQYGIAIIAATCVASVVIVSVIHHQRSTSDPLRLPPDLRPPVSTSRPPSEPAPRFIPTQPPTALRSPTSDFRPPPIATPQLSRAVQTLAGESYKKADYNDYRDALRQLTADMSQNDLHALTAFLERKAADQEGMRPIAFNGIKNDILDVLLRQDTLPEGIGTMLVDMYRDESYDAMWRDYCVQFMTAYYEIKWPSGASPSSDETKPKDKEREAIEAVYWGALKETDTTIAGTALLGLNSLSQQYSTIDRERVSQAAVDLLSNPEVGEPARITAFSIAASLGRQDALPEARAIAQTGATVTLRMAAIAAIGQLGSARDIELLSALAHDGEKRVRRIAERALKAARSRLAQQSTSACLPHDRERFHYGS